MEVNITKEAMDTLKILSSYDFEVAAWLCGEISKENEIIIDDWIIPLQEATGAAVDVDTEGIADTLKNHKNKIKRMIGQYHSHNSMGAFWSGTDEENMEKMMRRRNYFVFIVMSHKDDGKYTYKCTLMLNKPFKITQDCTLKVIDPELDKLYEKIDKEVEAKVKPPVKETKVIYDFTGNGGNYPYNWKDDYNNYSGTPASLEYPGLDKDECIIAENLLNQYGVHYKFSESKTGIDLFNLEIECKSRKQRKKLIKRFEKEKFPDPKDIEKIDDEIMDGDYDKFKQARGYLRDDEGFYY